MHSSLTHKGRIFVIALSLCCGALQAVENEPTLPAGSSDDIASAMKRFQLEAGLKVDLFASEPMLQNIVSFTFDNKGNSYVVETHRRRTSVFDVRNLQPWLEDDLSFTSVDDRANFYKKHLSGQDPAFLNAVGKGFEDFNHDGKRDWHDLEVESERIRKMEVHDGKVISTTTYSDDYKSLVSGVAAGVLTRGSNVWFTCIPDLWLLSGTNSSNQAATKKILHHGFGVHIAFGGHDMHGLKFGPDGRIYWSIADRGTHVEENGKVLIDLPHMGAVFRSEPDGSNLEVVAFGLRNPQELTFDDFGNLFTGDNNADGGDKARIVYVMPGSDSGWRIGWQWLSSPNKLGAWNAEGLWYGVETNSSPAILPPVAWVGKGPAGFTHYPGTGLPDRYKDHFFLADFPDGVRTFTLKAVGAGFTIGEDRRFMGGIFATDVEFSPWDGIYISDWVQGWDKTGKGRIYKVYSPDSDKTKLEEVRNLLAQDWSVQQTHVLMALLGHFDQRIRQEAQFELGARGASVKGVLTESAENPKTPQLVRIHSLWALSQIARKSGGMEKTELLQTLLKDSDPEIRAQAAKQAGELHQVDTAGRLISMLGDSSARTRSMAAISLGQLKTPEAVTALLTATKNNNNQDPYLRHALVMGLTSCATESQLAGLSNNEAGSVRLAAVLALKRQRSEKLANFLQDSDTRIQLETIRAIHDERIVKAYPATAALLAIEQATVQDQLWALRRIVNCNFLIGGKPEALALAKFAQRKELPSSTRVEALDALVKWGTPQRRDRITGLTRVALTQNPQDAQAAVEKVLPDLLADTSMEVLTNSLALAKRWPNPRCMELLQTLALNKKLNPTAREMAFEAVKESNPETAATLREVMIAEPGNNFRKLKSETKTALTSVADFETLLTKNDVDQKRAALSQIKNLSPANQQAVLAKYFPDLSKEDSLKLELSEAVKSSQSKDLATEMDKWRNDWKPRGKISAFKECLTGGDAKNGRAIFMERQDVGCLRCHKYKGEGGEVGPDLGDVGKRTNRDYILESIVMPNVKVAPGFENVTITLKNGTSVNGVVKAETDTQVSIFSGEDGLVKITKSNIERRDKGLSAMPEELDAMLTKKDIRDLVEFLATSK